MEMIIFGFLIPMSIILGGLYYIVQKEFKAMEAEFNRYGLIHDLYGERSKRYNGSCKRR